MKFCVYVISVVAALLYLVGCTEKPAEVQRAEAAEEAKFNTVARSQYGYLVQKVCIEGVSYLLYDNDSIISQINIEGKPVACVVDGK